MSAYTEAFCARAQLAKLVEALMDARAHAWPKGAATHEDAERLDPIATARSNAFREASEMGAASLVNAECACVACELRSVRS